MARCCDPPVMLPRTGCHMVVQFEVLMGRFLASFWEHASNRALLSQSNIIAHVNSVCFVRTQLNPSGMS